MTMNRSQEEGGMRFWLQRLPDLEEIRYSVASDQVVNHSIQINYFLMFFLFS